MQHRYNDTPPSVDKLKRRLAKSRATLERNEAAAIAHYQAGHGSSAATYRQRAACTRTRVRAMERELALWQQLAAAPSRE